MNDLQLSVMETGIAEADPTVDVILSRGDEEIYRRNARLFSENDVVEASNDIVREAGRSQADVDQALATQIEPIRIRLLRERDGDTAKGDKPEAEVAMSRYIATVPGKGDEPLEACMRDVHENRVLANFALVLDEEIEVQDDFESYKEFVGKLWIGNRTLPFRIRAKDYADGKKLWAAITEVAGCSAVRNCGMDELSRAISTVSKQAGELRRRKLTTGFGWTADGDAYLTPSLRISQAGIVPAEGSSEVRVDLSTEAPGCYLDMKQLEADELTRVKRHVVEDLLKLHDRVVTFTLLGASAAAVLYKFAPGAGRFALWLVGLTGAGKSLPSKLFMNFFGDFPVSSGRFACWSATPNYVQRQGYFFKDSLYLADDYKPEIVRNVSQFLGVLQTYADGTARGRLKSDATANVTRPIRGLLVCTGEDMPEHNASAIARSVIVHVPQRKKDLARKMRCDAECGNYSGVMADFLHWLLVENRIPAFVQRFTELQQRYYEDIAGQQNDGRIASNLALLGASFEQFAEYLADVWPEWKEAIRAFVEEDLVSIRGEMLGEAKEQQASEVFLRTLRELIQFNRVRVEQLNEGQTENKPLIGQIGGTRRDARFGQPGVQGGDRIELSMELALAEVNKSLREQGRAELKVTARTLYQQLREEGKLLGEDGEVLGVEGGPTYRVRIEGLGQRNVFALERRVLLGE